ncbi:hypothetical protein [Pedobacter sp. ASV12]|uniref:hypothetical protein n=1 Tax=Pedobacter sp. ASV12 TaxID=2795120 RepID=UPI0018EBA99F|nr:hypothetical protein [Pedobacter sp. ASV12]
MKKIFGLLLATAPLFSLAQDLQTVTQNGNTTTLGINVGGNVGIGTTIPTQKLTINGNLGFSGDNVNRYIITDATYTGTGKVTMQAGAGSDGFGGALNLYGHAHDSKPGWVVVGLSASAGVAGTGSEVRFTVNDVGLGGGVDLFTVLGSGNVGIGTTTPKEKLSVNGKIRAKEIKVESANWPDYVFEEDYKVGTLEALEGYIKANKRLPEMPSAKEVEANGVELGEMNKLLLKKVEELTLLLIDQNKKNEKQEQAIDELRKELEKVKSKK